MPTTCILISNSTAQAGAIAFASSSGVLRDPIAERPVLTFGLDQADEDVLSTEAEGGSEPVGDRLVKRLLLLDRPALVPGDLDNHQVLGAADVEIVQIEDEILGIVFTDHLKAVVFRHAYADQRFMHDAADRLAISSLLAFAEIDANERHWLFPVGLGLISACRPRGWRTMIFVAFDPRPRLRRAPALEPLRGRRPNLGLERKKRSSLPKSRNPCYRSFQ